ncbi:AI-2E family transporter [Gordonia soli]|uniref:AI-2E family transporter n=1 Tax=Gordonia soli NBRC 108243 TaxID=1223545 RepID=M0QF71_9ACTN|nr:AI-2E family transporter [Gordonia soli]GAC67104.1 hypothetical protein GS4_05_03170 [Gordonia soli NBRC 108243]
MSDADSVGRSSRDLAAIDRAKVHPLVRASAEWAWRLLLIVAAVYVLLQVFRHFEEVLVPVALAILGAAMLVPVVDEMDRRKVPRSLAVLLTIIVSLGILAAVLTFVVKEFIRGFPALTQEISGTVESVRDWLITGPFGVGEDQVRNIGNDILDFMQHNQDKVTSGALATAGTATEIVTGALLALFLLIFFLYGGGQIWTFTTKLVPTPSRGKVRSAGIAGFGTLVGYVRATVAVAFVDACGIGVGLAILQVPLALPLASLVFLGAFIPIVGALITGTLAVLVALVTKGWIAAVIATAIVVGVMQLESHVLQPFLLGRSVRLHPVAVVLAIAAGIVSAGIIGGLLAVPLIAFGNTFVRHLSGARHRSHENSSEKMYPAAPDAPRWELTDSEDDVVDDLTDDLADDAAGADGPDSSDGPDSRNESGSSNGSGVDDSAGRDESRSSDDPDPDTTPPANG